MIELAVAGVTFVVSLAVLLRSSDLFASAAETLGVSPFIIGATLVAGGTSLPEISVSVVAVRKGEVEIAVGNVLGSNIFNSFAVMGVPSRLGTLTVPCSVRSYAIPVMVLATLLYYFTIQDREITGWEGVMLLLLYALFLVNLLLLV